MVKNEENYGMGQTSKGNLDKTNKKTNIWQSGKTYECWYFGKACRHHC